MSTSSAAVALRRSPSAAAGASSVRHRVSIALVLLAALAFYLWTAGTSSSLAFLHGDIDPYNQLTTALLHGHTFLPLRPPAGLLHLRDPYDPAQNGVYSSGIYHDLALYHGRFYSTWGPSGTLLFAVTRIAGLRLAPSLAVAIYCFVGLAASVGLLHVLARRFVAAMPDWTLTVATIGLALTNVAPFLLRRPAQYEVAISSALCFEMLGLYLVVTGVLATRTRRARVAWGSFALGLALLARPTMAVGLLVLAGIAVVMWRRGEDWPRLAPALFGPFVLCAIALVAYNVIRFGGVGNFGTSYQLAGIDVMTKPSEELAYVPPGVFGYLFIPAQISLAFPHVFLQTTAQYPFALPRGYAGTPGSNLPEIQGGLLPTMPITVLLLGLPLAWWRRREGEGPALAVIAALVAATLIVVVLLAYALWGTTQRYMVDFATLALIGAFLLWGLCLGRLTPGAWPRRTLATAGVVLTALGALAGVAVSFSGYENLLALEHPHTYDDLQDATTPLVTGVTWITGRPAIIGFAGASPVSPPSGSPYLSFDAGGADTYFGGQPLTVSIASPDTRRTALTALAAGAGYPILGQVLKVTSAGGRTVIVPVISPSLRLPITLHAGLNDVVIRSLHATPTEVNQVEMTDVRVG